MHGQGVLVIGGLLASEDLQPDVHVFWQHCCGATKLGLRHEVFRNKP